MVHVIVDFMFIYYKYKSMIDANRMRRLITPVVWPKEDGTSQVLDTDVSYMYYALREIEKFRKDIEDRGKQVIMSVCFDSKTKRKEENTEYKANRENKLNSSDFEQINVIERLLSTAGHNTYKVDGMEADDIIANLAIKYKDSYEMTIINTSDADMLAHVYPNVAVNRYKARQGFTMVTANNFSAYCSGEMGCTIPYNTIILYKILCGDKSDGIKGVKGFGPAAFNSLIAQLNGKVDFTQFVREDYIKNVVSTHLGEHTGNQALEALSMVISKDIPDIKMPTQTSDRAKREEAYMLFNMKSLV